MKVKMTYRISDETGRWSASLEDVLNWPDVTNENELHAHVTAYLNNKYGTGNYTLDSIEVLAKL